MRRRKKDMQSGFVFHHLDSAVCRKSSACLRLPLLCDLKYTEHTHTYNTHCTTQGLYIHVTLEHPIQKRSWSACLKISELSCRKHKLLHKHAGGIQKDIRSKHWPWTGSQCEAGLQRRHPGLSRSLRNARSCSHTRSRGCLTAGKGTTTESQHTHTHTLAERWGEDTEEAQRCSTHYAWLHGDVQRYPLAHALHVQAALPTPVQDLIQSDHLSVPSGLKKTTTHKETYANLRYRVDAQVFVPLLH